MKIQDIAVSKMMSISIKIYKILLTVQGHMEWCLHEDEFIFTLQMS